MLVLLPPSEGKAPPPARGRPVDLAALAFPELAPTRRAVLAALAELCAGPPEAACAALGLGPTQAADVVRNRTLASAPALPAGRLYTGVLFDALGLASLPPAATRRANRRVLVTSGLWGMVRLGDRIPSYRLAGGVTLPGLGPPARVWREPLAAALQAALGAAAGPGGLVLDLRSGTYAAFWRPPPEVAARTVTVTVRQGGKVVSHHNKATKGRLARALLCARDEPRTPAALADALLGAGFPGKLSEPDRPGRTWELTIDHG